MIKNKKAQSIVEGNVLTMLLWIIFFLIVAGFIVFFLFNKIFS